MKGKKVIAKKTVFFRNSWTQGWGLIFRKPERGTAYIFDFKRELYVTFHMLFVFWPIDLYLLDAEKRVVEAKKRFLPFTLFKPKKRFCYALETLAGEVKLKKGDKVRF